MAWYLLFGMLAVDALANLHGRIDERVGLTFQGKVISTGIFVAIYLATRYAMGV